MHVTIVYHIPTVEDPKVTPGVFDSFTAAEGLRGELVDFLSPSFILLQLLAIKYLSWCLQV